MGGTIRPIAALRPSPSSGVGRFPSSFPRRAADQRDRLLMSALGGNRTLVRVIGIHADSAAASKCMSVGRRLLRRRAIAEDVAGDAAEQRDHSLAGNDPQQTKQ